MTEPLDLAIIGFGPASLSFLIALHDHSEEPLKNKKIRVFEKLPTFSWHEGMLIPGSNMQISFVKDLATPRDPTSYFTFLNYLHSHGQERLSGFLNMSTLEPSRYEYHDYLCWAAGHFSKFVEYNANINKLHYDAATDLYIVGHGDTQWQAKNIIITTGCQPYIPPLYKSVDSPLIVHSSKFMSDHSQKLLRNSKHGILVVGCGQSAAEIWKHCHYSLDPKTPLAMCFRNLAPVPSDSSPFVNSLYFDSHNSHWWYNLPTEARLKGLSVGRTTNYSVVKESLLEEMFKECYLQKLRYGQEFHQIMGDTDIQSIKNEGDHLVVQLTSQMDKSKKPETRKIDVLYVATGYDHESFDVLMSSLFPNSQGAQISEEYCVLNAPSKQGKVYVAGITSNQHGIGETLLSWAAIRAGGLAKELFGPSKPTARVPASYLN